ncbi:MAG: ferrochelatase [Nitriliruptoraceae bacterium]
MTTSYDAILLVSFGGPEAADQVMPFMENVTRGRNIPPERLEEVAEHYFAFGGKSPINDQNRALKHAMTASLADAKLDLPVYWGNRNWHPLLADTLRTMRDDGIERALCIVTSAYSSYSGCRQYREDLARARDEVGAGAPELDKMRVFYNHPGFLAPQADFINNALAELPADRRDAAAIAFVTHSIPLTMARHCDYEVQHLEACRLVMRDYPGRRWDLVYCSRSGPPFIPWTEPDVNDHLADLAASGTDAVVIVPIGFISDHMEVIHDLDVEAQETADDLGIAFARAGTAGIDDRFVTMITELVLERMGQAQPRAEGVRGPNHDVCPVDCCLTPGQTVLPTVAGLAEGAARPSA